MSLLDSHFIYGEGNSTSLIEMRAYVKVIDPYFDLRKLNTFFGNKAYYQDGHWHYVAIKSGDIVSRAVEKGLLIPVEGMTAPHRQVNAVAAARGLNELQFVTDLTDHAINWGGLIYTGVIRRALVTDSKGLGRPLSVYDLTWWLNQWSTYPVTEAEVIAAVDLPTTRVKLNWDMGSGYAWKDLRLLHIADLGWYKGPFAHFIAMNDGKCPPPPGESYGYGYVSLDEARHARDEVNSDDTN